MDNLDLIYNKLGQISNPEVFRFGAVRALIEIRWQYIFIRVILAMLLPFLGFFITFLHYTFNDYQSYISQKCASTSDWRSGIAS
mmetsp:Transcript_6962/g.5220  ORF Transcript_6962/g.5220 Transcript_6962/m.5220 type:complete len:84 (+) Transcript_6962:2018-2269(+)